MLIKIPCYKTTCSAISHASPNNSPNLCDIGAQSLACVAESSHESAWKSSGDTQLLPGKSRHPLSTSSLTWGNLWYPVGFVSVPLIALNEHACLSLSEQAAYFSIRGSPSSWAHSTSLLNRLLLAELQWLMWLLHEKLVH